MLDDLEFADSCLDRLIDQVGQIYARTKAHPRVLPKTKCIQSQPPMRVPASPKEEQAGLLA